MISVPPGHRGTLRSLFLPERPGPQFALQALRESRDECLVDRWPDPRAVALVVPGGLVLVGDPSAIRPADLRALAFKGMIEAPAAFVPLLQAAYSDLHPRFRIVGTLEGGSIPPVPAGTVVRRLVAGDERLARKLHSNGKWIWRHHRDPEAMVRSGLAWAAIVDGTCSSIALPFTRGDRYEDLAVFTGPDFRGMGLSPACVAFLVEDVKRRGRTATWSTLADNLASLSVARKVGFQEKREDVVFMTGQQTSHPRRPSTGRFRRAVNWARRGLKAARHGGKPAWRRDKPGERISASIARQPRYSNL